MGAASGHFLLALAAALLVGGCSVERQEPTPETPPVANEPDAGECYPYYRAHPVEARAKAEACSVMAQAAASRDANCACAQKALFVRRPVNVTFGPVEPTPDKSPSHNE